MKRYLVIAAVFAAACGGNDNNNNNPNAPGNTQPNTITFTAQLAASNEVPPVSNAEANATGSATITFNLTRDSAQNITGATATFVINLSNFPANTNANLAHIHEGGSGVAGGVRVNTGLSAASPLTMPGGSISNATIQNVPISDVALAQNIINNPAGFYFNVHTTLNPGGAVRGQLVRQ